MLEDRFNFLGGSEIEKNYLQSINKITKDCRNIEFHGPIDRYPKKKMHFHLRQN